MTRLVDIRPFPWSRPDAQRLHEALAHAFPRSNDAVAVAQNTGLDESKLNLGASANQLWRDIINYAHRRGLVEKLLLQARSKYPQGPLAVAIDAALACTHREPP